MHPEKSPGPLSAREAEVMLEPQSHILEVRGQIGRMITSLTGEIYLSRGVDIPVGQYSGIDEEVGADYPIRSHFGVRTGNGEMVGLEIGSTRLPDAPSEEPVSHYINYEGSDKIVFVEGDRILSVRKSAIESPDKLNRSKSGNLRKEFISPVEFALTRSALDAAENKRTIDSASRYSSAK